MRDVIITAVIVGLLPFIIARTYVGILVWSWIGFMNPHRLAWGFAQNAPFAQLVAIATFISLLFNREPKRFPINALTILWLIFIAWTVLTTLLALSYDNSQEMMIRTLKIQLVVLLSMVVLQSRERIHMLVWVIVFSLGFYGFKGGIFTIVNGGNYLVWGPKGSFIWGNNELALALLMTIPLMYYLIVVHREIWIRALLAASMLLCTVSALGSHSRGAFVAFGSVLIFFWLKSRAKLAIGFIILMMIPPIVINMPDHWFDRMSTIKTFQQDASAMGRIVAWQYSINLASTRPTGGGFRSYQVPGSFEAYGPPPPPDVTPFFRQAVYQSRAAHSIYFSVLGDHGWLGLALFLSIFGLSWFYAADLIRKTKNVPEYQWLETLMRMTQVSLVAYASGGAFLSLAYFDLPWQLLGIIVLCHVVYQQEMAAKSAAAVESPPAQREGRGAATLPSRPGTVMGQYRG